MNRSSVIFSLVIIFLVGMSLACSFSFSLKEPTPTPSPSPLPPTDTPIPPPPTMPPPPTAEPTRPPAVEVVPTQGGILNPNASRSGDVYYSEPMENLRNWSHFMVSGDQAGVNFEVFDGRWRSEIKAPDTYLYYLFEGGSFSDIRIDLEVENRGFNTNFVGMFCRYSENGWYEANILNTGEYFIYYNTGDKDSNRFRTMYKGASRLILTGKKTNNYTVICQSEQLSLYINGTEVATIPLRTGDFRFLPEGQVGLSVSTTNVFPILVDFLQFVLSVP